MNDAQLLALYMARKEEALTQTEVHYGTKCRRIAMGILHDPPEAEECVNDTFYQAWNTIPPQQPTHFGAFLGKITRNLALDRLRKRSAQKRGGEMLSLEQYTELEECIPDVTHAQPDDDHAVQQAVQDFLNALSQEQRSIFLKRYWYCGSIAEIAEDCNCTQSKVKTTLFRLRAKLKNYLAQQDIYV